MEARDIPLDPLSDTGVSFQNNPSHRLDFCLQRMRKSFQISLDAVGIGPRCTLGLLVVRRHRTAFLPNDPSSATEPAGGVDCNHSAMAGFAAAPRWHVKSAGKWLSSPALMHSINSTELSSLEETRCQFNGGKADIKL